MKSGTFCDATNWILSPVRSTYSLVSISDTDPLKVVNPESTPPKSDELKVNVSPDS